MGNNTLRAIGRSFLVMVVALLGLAVMSPTAVAADRYDVSYLWSRSLAGVRDYRDQVVFRPLLVTGVEIRIIATGSADTAF